MMERITAAEAECDQLRAKVDEVQADMFRATSQARTYGAGRDAVSFFGPAQDVRCDYGEPAGAPP